MAKELENKGSGDDTVNDGADAQEAELPPAAKDALADASIIIATKNAEGNDTSNDTIMRMAAGIFALLKKAVPPNSSRKTGAA